MMSMLVTRFCINEMATARRDSVVLQADEKRADEAMPNMTVA
jgi:hypothetical protein